MENQRCLQRKFVSPPSKLEKLLKHGKSLEKRKRCKSYWVKISDLQRKFYELYHIGKLPLFGQCRCTYRKIKWSLLRQYLRDKTMNKSQASGFQSSISKQNIYWVPVRVKQKRQKYLKNQNKSI